MTIIIRESLWRQPKDGSRKIERTETRRAGKHLEDWRVWVSRREGQETGIGQVSSLSTRKVYGGWPKSSTSPVRDHNELMFQVFPSFLEIICRGHTQEVGRSVDGTPADGRDSCIFLLISSLL